MREPTPEEKEMLETIRQIKELAIKLKDKLPADWWIEDDE